MPGLGAETVERSVWCLDLHGFMRSRASRKEERRRLFFAHQPLFVQTASLAARGLLFLLFVGLCRRPITIVIINSNCLLTTPRHDRSFCAVRRDGVAGAARQPRAPWPRAGAARPRPPDDEHQSLMFVVGRPPAFEQAQDPLWNGRFRRPKAVSRQDLSALPLILRNLIYNPASRGSS